MNKLFNKIIKGAAAGAFFPTTLLSSGMPVYSNLSSSVFASEISPIKSVSELIKNKTTWIQAFPDKSFRKYIMEEICLVDSSLCLPHESMKLSDIKYIQRTKYINVSCMEIKSLAGIEHFKSLEELNCRENKLYELDLKDIHVNNLNCSCNCLVYLRVNFKESTLAHLDCSNNNLSDIKFTNKCKIGYLDCSNNKIYELDDVILSENLYSAAAIKCDNNCLKRLDLKSQKRCIPGCQNTVFKILNINNKYQVDLSELKDKIESINIKGNGIYNKDSGIIIWDSIDEAKKGFSYKYNTGVLGYIDNIMEPVYARIYGLDTNLIFSRRSDGKIETDISRIEDKISNIHINGNGEYDKYQGKIVWDSTENAKKGFSYSCGYTKSQAGFNFVGKIYMNVNVSCAL